MDSIVGYVVLIFVVLLSQRTELTLGLESLALNESTQSNDTEIEVSDLLHRLIEKNDPLVRPHVGGPPVDVSVDFYVVSLGAIDEVTMDYTVDIALRQRWNDARLAYGNSFEFVKVTASSISKIWTPDIYFPNEKRALFHDATVPNKLLKIFPTGDVLYSIRITLVNSCPMDLRYFPMDRQRCLLKFESYSYEESEMKLSWLGDDPIEIDDALALPEMTLAEVRTRKCRKRYKTGIFPCLEASFILERRYGFFILQTYVPSILIVILSWVSFWINIDAIPARISLGVTTVLTMTTQLSGSKGSIPKVSYPKAIDIWMSTCMIFVFAALLEFAFVNAVTRKEARVREATIRRKEQIEEHSKPARSLHHGSTFTGRQMARGLDHVSRVVFPTLFTLFNVVYWAVYLNHPHPDKS